MHARVMKLFSISALLIAVLYWKQVPRYRMELDLVVCAAAVVILTQALQGRKYFWAGGFSAIALLFNPLVPIFPLTGLAGLSIVAFSMVPFSMALFELRPHRLMSMPSITDRNPGSRSL
jgi:uncharacterized protein DUF6804